MNNVFIPSKKELTDLYDTFNKFVGKTNNQKSNKKQIKSVISNEKLSLKKPTIKRNLNLYRIDESSPNKEYSASRNYSM